MKRLLLVTCSLALILPEIAMAQATIQPVPDRNRPARPGPGQGTRPTQPRPPVVQPGRPGGPQIQPPRPGGPQIQPPRPGRPEIQPPRPRPPSVVRPPHRPGYRPPQFRPIRGPAYRYPRGHNYRRWRIGLFLPAIFFSNYYYYNNYAAFGFGAPPRGYRWVRYGPDLLLVHVRTRRIVDVIHGAFYR